MVRYLLIGALCLGACPTVAPFPAEETAVDSGEDADFGDVSALDGDVPDPPVDGADTSEETRAEIEHETVTEIFPEETAADVADGVADEQDPGPELEADGSAETEADLSPTTDGEAEADGERMPDGEIPSEVDAAEVAGDDVVQETEPGPEDVADESEVADTASEPETVADTASEPETVADTASEPETVADTASEPETVADTTPEPETVEAETTPTCIPVPEICNGLDDDCDESTDEDFGYEGLPIGWACHGRGVCGLGEVVCISSHAATCSTMPGAPGSLATSEICDGEDNDCDGQYDEGLDCIDDCVPNPCDNGGTCTDGPGTFTCRCPSSHEGPTCAVVVDNCAGHACGEGLCIDGYDSYTCQCPDGTFGDGTTRCTTCPSVDHCEAVTCTSAADSFCASCHVGFEPTPEGACSVSSDMVAVPGGAYAQGCDACEPSHDGPEIEVTLTAFSIDRTEVPAGAYLACMNAGVCEPPIDDVTSCHWDPLAHPAWPADCITHAGASAYCAWVGKRLPTEAEWEAAARGPDLRLYPWGDEAPDCARANFAACGLDRPVDVDTLPDGASPYGALHMAGNLHEWVRDVFAADALEDRDGAIDPPGPATGSSFAGRGAGHGASAVDLEVRRRWPSGPDATGPSQGFRCAMTTGSDGCDEVDNDHDGATDEDCADPECGLLGPCPSGFTCTEHGTCERAESNEAAIPAGTFWMGCNPARETCSSNARPAHLVNLPAYAIDRTEVTAAQWRACVQAGACPLPRVTASNAKGTYDDAALREHPINFIAWREALAYCEWPGKAAGAQRLCTEAEWERAARGGCETLEGECESTMRLYPWGDDPATCDVAHLSVEPGTLGCQPTDFTAPVGSRPLGRSIYGALDLSGNVAEMVFDRYAGDYYATSPSDAPFGPTLDLRFDRAVHVLRGQSYQRDQSAHLLSSYREGVDNYYLGGAFDGFRCCRELVPDDPCEPDPCGPHGTCEPHSGYCECEPGYSDLGAGCVDDDECVGEGDGDVCDPDASCLDIDGGLACDCDEALVGDGFACREPGVCDTTECAEGFTCTADDTCERDESDEVWVPPGTFWMGCNPTFEPSCAAWSLTTPQVEVTLSGYAIDRHEVTAEEYRACVTAGVCPTPRSSSIAQYATYEDIARRQHPVNYVDWSWAATYCAWSGKDKGAQRLCTEAEWERAARGGCETLSGDCKATMRTFPWGEIAPTCGHAISSSVDHHRCRPLVGTSEVGATVRGRSPYGAFDMAGNVAEWVDGSLVAYPSGPLVDPPGTISGDGRVVRGGDYQSDSAQARTWMRRDMIMGGREAGFRCCRSVDPPAPQP